MISFDNIPNVYIAAGYTDLRKGIDGYAHIVQDNFHISPFQNAMFIFCNRQRDKIKILYWDTTGWWLMYKRLESGHFKWKKDEENKCVEITKQQLQWLLDGLKLEQKSAFKKSNSKFV